MNQKNQRLGVLGGGQLGRMLIQSAINFNQEVYCLDPDPQAPCSELAQQFTVGSLQDFDAVYAFGKTCDVLTIEIESVNTAALERLEKEGIKVFPQPEIIRLIQDKREQKQFYQKNGIPTAAFILTEGREDVFRNKDFLPAVHKLGKDGYDGRGVQVLHDSSDLERAFDQPGVLEKRIDFEAEIAVTVARNERGDLVVYPPVACAFHPTANLVEFLFAPAEIADTITSKASEIAKDIILKLDMVGILAVEMFVTKQGDVLVNEIAPRPHNSGHHTIEANYTSQFEQHLRSVMNWPLGDPGLRCPAAMVNLLGEAGYEGIAYVEGMEEALQQKGVYFHLYGKKITKPFRKMGHVTLLDSNLENLKKRAIAIKNLIKIKA